MLRFVLAGAVLATALAGVVFAQEKKDEKNEKGEKGVKDLTLDKGLKELEGAYRIVSAERVGKVAAKETIDPVRITIKGDEFTLNLGGDEKKARIKVDATKTPHTIDISPADGPERGKTFPGIVKVEKGEVTLAYVEKDKAERPKDFKAEGEVVVLKLKKDEKK